MAEATGIEWCDHTWNPWIGCTRISAACDHCYAATLAHRYGWARFEAGAPRKRTSTANWKLPARWNAKAAAAGRPATVFPSLCDPFDSEVDPAWLGEVLDTFAPLQWLRLLLLTKRPHLAAKYFAGRTVPDNVALGVTAENQDMLALRGPQILGIPARWHFLSYEPALGLIDARPFLEGEEDHGVDMTREIGSRVGACTGWRPAFDWVIAGGESGPKARDSHPDWFRSLRDQCRAAGVPFFFKQWGEWGPGPAFTADISARRAYRGEVQTLFQKGKPDIKLCIPTRDDDTLGEPLTLYRYGKKLAGAQLDGREWREFPAW